MTKPAIAERFRSGAGSDFRCFLVTFLKKADEVNLLVNDKDEVEFTLDEYKPFIDDPLITRVVKALPADAPEPDKAPAVPAKAAVKTPLAAKPHAPVR